MQEMIPSSWKRKIYFEDFSCRIVADEFNMQNYMDSR